MNGPRIPESQPPTEYFAALERHPVDAGRASEMFEFEGHHIRVVRAEDGEPWFVARDVCSAIGLTNLTMALDRVADDQRGVSRIDTLGGPQNAATVSESGLYMLVLRSDKPDAAKFQQWVTREVLPAIRKTGTYSRYPAAPQQLPSKRELAQWVIEAEERAEAAEAQVRELTPSASAFQELVDATGDWSVADAAKCLSRDPNITTGRDRLFDFMRGQRWIYRDNGRWRAYQTQVDLGRLTEKLGKPYVRDGQIVNAEPTVRITAKGIRELHKRLGGTGQHELMASVS